jgi:hypothetical protein
MNGFIPGLSLASSDVNRVDYIQAAEASVMQAKFAEYITALIAENSGRQTPLNVVDIAIAGGGDGHTFVLSSTVSTVTSATTGWVAASLVDVKGVFWMGADENALADYSEPALVQLLASGNTFQNIASGIAGAAKGTRFMAFMAGVDAGPG